MWTKRNTHTPINTRKINTSAVTGGSLNWIAHLSLRFISVSEGKRVRATESKTQSTGEIWERCSSKDHESNSLYLSQLCATPSLSVCYRVNRNPGLRFQGHSYPLCLKRGFLAEWVCLKSNHDVFVKGDLEWMIGVFILVM